MLSTWPKRLPKAFLSLSSPLVGLGDTKWDFPGTLLFVSFFSLSVLVVWSAIRDHIIIIITFYYHVITYYHYIIYYIISYYHIILLSHYFFLFFFICSEFCHTLEWNGHGFTCVPHPDPPSHLPLHPLPLGFPSAPGPSACLMHPTWAGDLFHPRYCTCFEAAWFLNSSPRVKK